MIMNYLNRIIKAEKTLRKSVLSQIGNHPDYYLYAKQKASNVCQTNIQKYTQIEWVELKYIKRNKVHSIQLSIYKDLTIYLLQATPMLAITPRYQGDFALCFHLSLDHISSCVIFFIIGAEIFFELKLNKLWTQENRRH